MKRDETFTKRHNRPTLLFLLVFGLTTVTNDVLVMVVIQITDVRVEAFLVEPFHQTIIDLFPYCWVIYYAFEGLESQITVQL